MHEFHFRAVAVNTVNVNTAWFGKHIIILPLASHYRFKQGKQQNAHLLLKQII